MEAVRMALGDDPNLTGQEGADYVKQRFGLGMSPEMFGSYRSSIHRGKGGAKRRRGRRGRKAAAESGVHKAAGQSRMNRVPRGRGAAAANPLEAARQVKELVDRFGADTVRGMVELFE
jgi:hypothetical protein